MRKVYELNDHFDTGEATIQPVLLWGANGRPIRESFSKTASEASDYIKSVQPLPGKTIVLVLALGAYETYDLNRNGDGFNEFPYKPGYKVTCGHPACQKGDAWVSRGELITDHFKTFEQFATIYKHHQNKDPSKSYGDVLKAFWNPQMHRVELLLGIDNAKAPDIVQRIADGEYPAVSMGCRIAYDVCTICGHRAPTRAQYCDHLKFKMRQVMPNGLRAGALNPTPKFFDISFVVKPADQTGYMLKKVANVYEIRSSAELGEKLSALEEKRAMIRKMSDIDKTIRGVTVDSKSSLSPGEQNMLTKYRDSVALPLSRRAPTFSRTTIRIMSSHPLPDVLTSLKEVGVHPTTAEMMQLILNKTAPGLNVSDDALDRATFLKPFLFDLFEKHPGLLDHAMGSGLYEEGKVDPEIVGRAAQYLEKRSALATHLAKDLRPYGLREDPPRMQALHMTDPATGQPYTTTRGAAQDAESMINNEQVAKLLGGAALLAAAHSLVAGSLPESYRPAAAVAALGLGAHALKPNYGEYVMTDEGVRIPVRTEMVKNSEVGPLAIPALAASGAVTALAHDYQSRLERGEDVDNPDASLGQRIYNRLAERAHRSPISSILASLLAYGVTQDALTKFSSYVDPVVGEPVDSVSPPPVDFDRAATKIGSLLL